MNNTPVRPYHVNLATYLIRELASHIIQHLAPSYIVARARILYEDHGEVLAELGDGPAQFVTCLMCLDPDIATPTAFATCLPFYLHWDYPHVDMGFDALEDKEDT